MTSRHTPLYQSHLDAGAKMVDFAGWAMPIHYGSQVEEHHQVRRAAGVFDVSHMGIVDVHGDGAEAFLRRLLANDVARLKAAGRALYSCLLNEAGGVLDDLIVYRGIEPESFRIVVNAGTRAQDLAWFREHAPERVVVAERQDLAMLAVQGPEARAAVHRLLGAEAAAVSGLARFAAVAVGDWYIARTGYTGEEGYEIMLPNEQAPAVWQRLLADGVAPCGLGARDTLRLEAGMNLYGQDMDTSTTPLVSALGWTVAWEPVERDFIGRAALERQRAEGVPQRLVGLVLLDRGVLRPGQRVVTGAGDGVTTSGSFAPTLNRAIALARVPADSSDEVVTVEIRGRLLQAKVAKPPFVREGKVCIDVD